MWDTCFDMQKIKLALICLLLVFFSLNAGEIKDNEEKQLLSEFPNARLEFTDFIIPSEIKNRIELSTKQRFFMKSVYVWKIYSGEELKALSILDNVLGKSLPITFRVTFDTTGEIINSKIVKYRETIGGGVNNDSWNRQFIGKDSKSSYNVGEDIDGISGATISVHSVTKGIQKLSLLAEYLLNDEKN